MKSALKKIARNYVKENSSWRANLWAVSPQDTEASRLIISYLHLSLNFYTIAQANIIIISAASSPKRSAGRSFVKRPIFNRTIEISVRPHLSSDARAKGSTRPKVEVLRKATRNVTLNFEERNETLIYRRRCFAEFDGGVKDTSAARIAGANTSRVRVYSRELHASQPPPTFFARRGPGR